MQDRKFEIAFMFYETETARPLKAHVQTAVRALRFPSSR